MDAGLPAYVRGRAFALRPNVINSWKLTALSRNLLLPALSDVQPMGGEFLLAVSMLLVKRQIVVVDASSGLARNLFTSVFLSTDTDALAMHLRQQPREQWLVLSTSDANQLDGIWRTLHPATWRLANIGDQQSAATRQLASIQSTLTDQLVSVGCTGMVNGCICHSLYCVPIIVICFG